MNWTLRSNFSAKKMDASEILKNLLKNRGYATKKEIDEFLNPKLEKVTVKNVGIESHEIKKAVDLIKKTIKENKAIIIYGDYDVDGITGTAILWESLYSLYKNTHPYIPHRIDEGYGLSKKGIQNLEATVQDIGLIITVDNGIVASSAVEYAKSLGIQVIITDHHIKGVTLPKADAIVHTTELCGAGVGYLLSKEIAKQDQHLELVALATIADLVSLNIYNRTLVKFGLEKLKKTKRVGLLALFEEAQMKQNEISTYHIGHIIAPRINASGRISHALDSLRLLCTTDNNRAKKLAKKIGDINRERQSLTISSAENAIASVKTVENFIFVQSEMYEQGVVGLVASRLVEAFYRPSIAVSVGNEISKGSARSITGVNIIELIRSCSDFLSEAGGHPMAAGFSVQTKKLADFKKAIQKKAEEIDEKLFEREIKIDLELEFENITLELFAEIQKLSPFGMGNPVPVFLTRGVQISHLKTVGKDGNHLQLLLEKDGRAFKGILFNHARKGKVKVGDVVDVVYSIELNSWREKKNIELKLKDQASTTR